MNDKLQRTLESLIPFFMIGVGIALLVGVFIMFSYVLVWGILIGAILWLVNFVKNLLFPEKKPVHLAEKSKGRIIEHDDQD